MAEIGFDFSALNGLAADLGEIADEALPNVEKAVEVTARHIKDDGRTEARRQNPRHARGYPFAVDYDMESKDGAISAQIGPNLAKNQGALGILEEASGGVRARPQGNARRALRNNLADFEKGILKATGKIA